MPYSEEIKNKITQSIDSFIDSIKRDGTLTEEEIRQTLQAYLKKDNFPANGNCKKLVNAIDILVEDSSYPNKEEFVIEVKKVIQDKLTAKHSQEIALKQIPPAKKLASVEFGFSHFSGGCYPPRVSDDAFLKNLERTYVYKIK